MKSESDEATTSNESDSDFGGEEDSELDKDEKAVDEINEIENENEKNPAEDSHLDKREGNDLDKNLTQNKFENSILEKVNSKYESEDFDESALKQSIIENKNRLANMIFDQAKLDKKRRDSSSTNSPDLTSKCSSRDVECPKEIRKSPIKTPDQSVPSTPKKLIEGIENEENKKLENFQAITTERNDDQTECFSAKNHPLENENENELTALDDNETELSSLVPQNEPVPEPAPSKPRLESRVVISAASSCTIPSPCNTPEPVRIKSSAGGYEDILNVLERLEDELDGQDKRQEDRSASTTSRSTRSSSMSSTSTSSRSSGKSGSGNLSKIKFVFRFINKHI